MSADASDILAATDVVDDIAEQSDSFDPETTVGMLEAIGQLERSIRTAKSMLRTQLISQLESPKQIGSKIYAVVDEYKTRPEHEVIRARIISRAAGLDSIAAAATYVYDRMMALFVAPSSEPKTGGLKQLELSKKMATRQEFVGKALQVIDTAGGVDDDD